MYRYGVICKPDSYITFMVQTLEPETTVCIDMVLSVNRRQLHHVYGPKSGTRGQGMYRYGVISKPDSYITFMVQTLEPETMVCIDMVLSVNRTVTSGLWSKLSNQKPRYVSQYSRWEGNGL